ncbi:MAG: right-handed parallel beta-helix repeat-containing protein [Xanthobacteraceae bacterium]
MKKIAVSTAILGGILGALLQAAPANAQATRTWVSGVGDDANPCSRTAPCKTFPGAISKTAAGGEINCLDPGGFGGVTIGKSISIVCDYTEGGLLVAGTNAIIINAPANSIVTLKGIDIECVGTGINGVNILGVGVTVHIHKMQIRNCRGTNGNGILVAPSSGTAKVFVADSYITDNGQTSSNAGLLVRPTGGAAANVTVFRTQFENNQNGIFMDGAGGGGGSNVVVKDSAMTGNSGNGIAVSSTGAIMAAVVADSMISVNGAGAATAGASARLRLGGNTIAGNGTGVSNGGGTLESFKNNQIVGNGADGTPLGAVNSGGNILN